MRMPVSFGAIACAAAALVSCPAPASADFCELSWDVPCCPIPGTNIGKADVVLTICNCTDQPAVYRFQMKSPDMNTQFDPPMGMITLPPGECIDIPITVYCPPLPPGEGLQIFANVVNQATGAQFECAGLVKGVQDFKVTPIDPVIPVPIPDPTLPPVIVVPILGTNIGGGLDPLLLTFEAMGPILPPAPMSVPIPPGDTQGLELMVQAVTSGNVTEGAVGGPPTTATLLIKWDDDGDGFAEVNSSVNFRFEATGGCAADLNGDGQVNGADLANLLASWGLCP